MSLISPLKLLPINWLSPVITRVAGIVHFLLICLKYGANIRNFSAVKGSSRCTGQVSSVWDISHISMAKFEDSLTASVSGYLHIEHDENVMYIEAYSFVG
jgi:hypothetical protein